MASIYISSRSKFKSKTITHIIETIHYVRSKNEDVIFCIFSDANHVVITDVLNWYGALHQVVLQPTRKDKILDIILADLHTCYHSPLLVPPLQVDDDTVGKDSDHRIILFAPIPEGEKQTLREYKYINSRPLPQSCISQMGQFICRYPWSEVFLVQSANDKVINVMPLWDVLWTRFSLKRR